MREQVLLSRRALATTASAAIFAISAPALAVDRKDATLLALGSELEAVHAEREACEAADPDFDDEPFYERHWHLREAINHIPATTLAGIAVKGRAAQMALHHDPDNECECAGSFRDLSCSMVEDLLRLTARGGANA